MTSPGDSGVARGLVSGLHHGENAVCLGKGNVGVVVVVVVVVVIVVCWLLL